MPGALVEAWQRPQVFGPHTGVARAVTERGPVHIADMTADPAYGQRDPIRVQTVERLGARTGLFVPMLKEGTPVGVIVTWRREVQAFSESHIQLLSTFADQAVIAIENVRLFTELGARNRDLTETLEQQTATSEILRVISSSPTDVQPVCDIIAANTLKLCDAHVNAVTLYDGELLHLVALANVNPEGAEALRQAYPRRADWGHGGGRAVSTRAVVQIPDVLTDRVYELKSEQQAAGYRSVLAVPMLRDGEPIGAISLGRREPRPFSDKQIALVKTFADQAVIAIENVRLFRELRARTAELTRSVEQLTALARSAMRSARRWTSRPCCRPSSCGRISSPARQAATSGRTTSCGRSSDFARATTRTSATPRHSRHRGACPRFPRDRGSRPG
jgi:two-component system, NtrC family, sensor kinase